MEEERDREAGSGERQVNSTSLSRVPLLDAKRRLASKYNVQSHENKLKIQRRYRSMLCIHCRKCKWGCKVECRWKSAQKEPFYKGNAEE